MLEIHETRSKSTLSSKLFALFIFPENYFHFEVYVKTFHFLTYLKYLPKNQKDLWNSAVALLDLKLKIKAFSGCLLCP